ALAASRSCRLVALFSRAPFGQAMQVLAVLALRQGVGQLAKLLSVDPAAAIGDLLQAADAQALALLDRPDELAGLDQAVVGAGVEPGEAAAQQLDVQLAGVQIDLVEGGDLQLAAVRRL